MSAEGTLEIADHRERHACVTGEVLPEAQARGRDALVATPDALQLGTLRPEPVYAGFEAVNAMGIQIKLDEPYACKISKQWTGRHSEDGRELGQRHRSPSTKVERRAPHSGDLAK